MRVLLVLFALVATPFLVSAAQDPHGLNCNNGQGDENRSAQGQAHAHKGACATPTPPPTAECAVQASGGSGSIDGWVFNTLASWPNGLEGWCVELTGTTAAGAPITAAVKTDGTGFYSFTGLPGGTYTVCEVIPSGWVQQYPSSGPRCTTGFGLLIDLPDGMGWGWQNFGN